MENLPVLITGAGPTGLTLANLLARMRVPFLLIDKKEHPTPDSKAFAIHARSLEIFDQIGMAEKAVEMGNTESSVHLIVKNKVVFSRSLKDFLPGETNFPYFLILPQQQTEQLLLEALETVKQNVHWEHELEHMKIRENDVLVSIKNKYGKEIEYCVQYVVGCDGANSTVRKQAGFSFEGKTFSPTFYLADCELEWKFTHGDIYFILAPNYLTGMFSYKKAPEFRIFNFLNTALEKKGGKLTDEEVQNIADNNPYLKINLKKINWTSVFKIHSRYTGKFRKGRVILAGDAAHVHSPAGGQGMNTGIQDAYNLAWKLSLVSKNIAGEQLLDTYHYERYPIAKNLHNSTDRFFGFMINHSKIWVIYRMFLLPVFLKIGMSLSFVRKTLFKRASQIAIKYPKSPLSRVGSSSGFRRQSPKPGNRMPYFKIRVNNVDSDSHKILKCTHFSIFVAVDDPESDAVKKLVKKIKIMNYIDVDSFLITKTFAGGSFFVSFGIKKSAIIIVRPDGHIGFRTSNLSYTEVEDYFNSIFHKEDAF